MEETHGSILCRPIHLSLGQTRMRDESKGTCARSNDPKLLKASATRSCVAVRRRGVVLKARHNEPTKSARPTRRGLQVTEGVV